MTTIEHLLITLSEECTEVMEALYTDTEDGDLTTELRDVIAVADLINQRGEFSITLPLLADGRRVHFISDSERVESDLHKTLLKLQYFISKSLRFGSSDIKPGGTKNNAEEIESLMMDYAYHIQALAYKMPDISYDVVYDKAGIAAKQEKVLKHLELAINKGTLHTPVSASKRAIEDIELIKGLCINEASLINQLFVQSEKLGLMALDGAIAHFEAYLKQQDPLFIHGMSIEYRTFVVELLLLIDEPYKDVATAKVLMGR